MQDMCIAFMQQVETPGTLLQGLDANLARRRVQA